MDREAMERGWTHRRKRKSRDPYLKLDVGRPLNEGAIYTDMDKKFRWIADEEVVEL